MRIDNEILVRLREEMNWTQEELAAAAGLSTRTVQRLEASGQGALDTVRAMAAALNVDTDILVWTPISRKWMMGPTVGAIAGIVGCLFAYASIFATAGQMGRPLNEYWASFTFITIFVLFAILYPACFFYLFWNYRYDRRKGFYSPT